VDTKGVVNLVSNGSGPVPVPDEVVAAVERILGSGLPVQPLPWLKAGTRVRVAAGPLCGLEGEVDSLGRNSRLFVSIRAIGQSVTVDIDMRDVVAA
jgi:transcription antitermination factor NusG